MRMLKNFVQQDRTQITIWHMRVARWTRKARNKHSEYITLIAFPLQQWFTRTYLNVTLYVQCLSYSCNPFVCDPV
jgi:hypothetical protein